MALGLIKKIIILGSLLVYAFLPLLARAEMVEVFNDNFNGEGTKWSIEALDQDLWTISTNNNGNWALAGIDTNYHILHLIGDVKMVSKDFSDENHNHFRFEREGQLTEAFETGVTIIHLSNNKSK